jgi:hypothetical protein
MTKFKISRLSIASFILLLAGILFYCTTYIVAVISSIDKKPVLMEGAFALWISALTLGIIDLVKKDRNKVLSIISVTVSAIPIGLFLVILIILLLFGV